MPKEEVCTPVAFINGTVRVLGLPDDCGEGITIIADGDGQARVNTTASKDPRKFCFAVKPGSWSVFAQFGPVRSDTKVVSVQSGKTAEVDFCFGDSD